MRIYMPMRIDADIRIIRHMSDIARYMRRIFQIGILSASAWPSLLPTMCFHILGDMLWHENVFVLGSVLHTHSS